MIMAVARGALVAARWPAAATSRQDAVSCLSARRLYHCLSCNILCSRKQHITSGHAGAAVASMLRHAPVPASIGVCRAGITSFRAVSQHLADYGIVCGCTHGELGNM